jgi:hypothetical protein
MGFDGLERITAQQLMDILEVPQSRVPQAVTATLMTKLGWTAVRVRDLTRGGP